MRISARLNYKKPSVWDRLVNRATNPKMAYSLILFIILVNVVLMAFWNRGTIEKENDPTSKFSTEYDIAVNGVYDIENNDPNEGE